MDALGILKPWLLGTVPVLDATPGVRRALHRRGEALVDWLAAGLALAAL